MVNFIKKTLLALAISASLVPVAQAQQYSVVLTTGAQSIHGTKTFLDILNVTGLANFGTSVTANAFFGNGSALTSLTPANITLGTAGINISGNAASASTVPASGVQSGSLGGGVITSSIAVGAINAPAQVAAGTLVGSNLANNTVTNTQVANAAFANITGLGAQAQALNMNSHLINSVTDPASAQDAATKNYVDTNVNGLDFKPAGRLATTAALPSNSYNNGAGTITGLGLGLLTIDGVTPAVSDRVLINNEGTASHNGIYSVTVNGGGAFYILTRVADFNIASEMASGVAIFITSGTTNIDTGWVTTSSVTTVGTDPITFVQFTGLGDVTAGSGLSKSGNTISLKDPIGITNGITASSGTFTQTGNYSVLASSGISALLFKGDGSQLTNLPAAGGGATMAGPNTFTGANTFSSAASITYTAGTTYTGLAGGIVATTSPSAAATTTISSLNGNTSGRWKIVISGLVTGSDGGLSLMQPNGDTGSNYQGQLIQDYEGTTSLSYSTGFIIHRNATTGSNSVYIVIHMQAATLNSMKRAANSLGGGDDGGSTYHGMERGGGVWTNTSSNITSMLFTWNTSFTGTVTIYQD